MHEGGDVDEFQDHRKAGVVGIFSASGSACHEGERGADALSGRLADIGHITLDGWIKSLGLITDGSLDHLEILTNQLERKHWSVGGGGRRGGHRLVAEVGW